MKMNEEIGVVADKRRKRTFQFKKLFMTIPVIQIIRELLIS